MSRGTRTILSIVIILVSAVLLSFAAYGAGQAVSGGLVTGTKVTRSAWISSYSGLLIVMGGVSAAISLLWFLLARFALKIDSPFGVGKRLIWAILGIAAVAACIAIPYLYAASHYSLIMGPVIPAIFVVLYAVIGYWIISIFTTPSPYKHTPIGASIVRKPWIKRGQ